MDIGLGSTMLFGYTWAGLHGMDMRLVNQHAKPLSEGEAISVRGRETAIVLSQGQYCLLL